LNNRSIQHFRKCIEESCSGTSNYHIVVSYSRKLLQQTGDGHYSPIGGYHKGRDLVLLLDVARFKHPPHWVSIPLLWDAMNAIDALTNYPRGYFLLSRNAKYTCSSFCKIAASPYSWSFVYKQLNEVIPALLAKEKFESVEDVIERIFECLPSDIAQLIKRYPEDSTHPEYQKEELKEYNKKLLQEISETEMYRIVKKVLERMQLKQKLSNEKGITLLSPEVATILLLSCPSQLYTSITSSHLREILIHQLRHLDLMPTILRDQVMGVRYSFFLNNYIIIIFQQVYLTFFFCWIKNRFENKCINYLIIVQLVLQLIQLLQFKEQ
jgi:glutathione gamma-glutamylcysteinyltransferase